MGGNAQRQERRLTTPEWSEIGSALKKTLMHCGLFKRIEVLRPLPEKETHGDIDLIVMRAPHFNQKAVDETLETIGLTDRIDDSWLYRRDDVECQVDIKFVDDDESFHLLRLMGDFGECGMIVGSYAKNIGYVISSKSGLMVPMLDQKYSITRDVDRILLYLGLDAKAWQNGFATKKELMEWLRPTFPYVQNLKSERPFYGTFMLQDFDKSVPADAVKEATSRMKELGDYDGYETARRRLCEEKEKKVMFARAFNGRIVQHHLKEKHGLIIQGKELGKIMKRIKECLPSDTIPLEEEVKKAIDQTI